MQDITLRLFLIGVFLFCFPAVTAFSNRQSCTAKYSHQTSRTIMCTAVEEIRYGGLHHCGILVSDVEKSKLFYMNVLGFADETHLRPLTLPYPGAFLRVGRDQIHLMGLPNPDPTAGRPDHGGRDRHVAINVNNIDHIMTKLVSENVKYTLSMSGRRALFCRDLDGNAFEFMEDTSL